MTTSIATPTTFTGNPYVGPRTFIEAQGQLFFGREQAARDLTARVVSERLMLFYAQSGAGKSSLINTRLIPYLRDLEGFQVLPVGRVSGHRSDELGSVDNIYVFNLMSSLDQSSENPIRLTGLTLSQFLASIALESVTDEQGQRTRRWAYRPQPISAFALDGPSVATQGPRFVLIIDQFEEIITGHAERWAERAAFFQQLNQAISDDPSLWVVLTLREDYVAALDPYADLLFNRLRARFYMERMGTRAALEAVTHPAQLGGRPFAPGVAEQLVDNLRQVRVMGQQAVMPGQYVEPVQLQVVCYQLWENLTQATGEVQPIFDVRITSDDLQAAGDVDEALEQFYEEALSSVVADPNTDVTERQLRTWFATQLITDIGTRGLVHRDETTSAGLTNDVVDLLMHKFLLRTELRAGSAWIELVHDRFVEPITRSNEAWWPKHLSPLQRQAALWQEENRPAGFLLRGNALQEAEAWAAVQTDTLEDHEKDFLVECQKARDITEREHRQSRRIRGLVVALAVFAVFAFVAAGFALNSSRKAEDAKNLAEQEARRASSGELSAKAQYAIESQSDDPSLALDLAIQAVESTWNTDSYVTEAASSVLVKAIRAAPAWRISLVGHDSQVLYAVFSPDSKRILTTSTDKSTLVWNSESGQELLHLKGHIGAVNQAIFSADGRFIYTASDDLTMREWDATTGKERMPQFIGHNGIIWSLAMSTDGQQLVTASNDRSVRIWDLETRKTLHILNGHQDIVWSAIFNQKGDKVLTASADGTARIWDIATEQAEMIFSAKTGGLQSAHYDPLENQIVTAGTDKIVRIWNVNSGEELKQLAGHTDIVKSASFSADGRLVISVGEDHSVRIQPNTGQELRQLNGHKEAVNSISFSPNNERVITASDDKTARIWDIQSLGGIQEFTMRSGAVNGVGFSPSGKQLVMTGQNGEVQVWDAQSGSILRVLTGHTWPVTHVEFTSDGAEMVTASNDGTARIWDTQTGSMRLKVSVPAGILWAASFSPAGNLLATVGSDPLVRLWDPDTGRLLAELSGHQGTVESLDFSPDGSTLATAGDDGIVRLWDVESRKQAGQIVVKPSSLNPFINSVVFAPDGQTIVTDGYDGVIRIWDRVDLHLIRKVGAGYPGPMNRAVVSPDGTQIAAAGGDGVAYLWDISNGQLLLTLPSNGGPINDIVFAPDGNSILTGNADQRARQWPVRIKLLLELAQSLIQEVRADSITVGGSGPEISCNFSVDAGFEATYTAFQAQLGCPVAEAYRIDRTSEQSLQGGHMFWRNDGKPIRIVFDRSLADGSEISQGLWSSGPPSNWVQSDGLEAPPGQYMFSIDIGFVDELDADDLSSGLRRQFAEHNRALTENHKVITKKKGTKWIIDDGRLSYDILLEEQTLRIYLSLYEPRLGFGGVWHTQYAGPDGPLGWALAREDGSDATLVQDFARGFIWRSKTPKTYVMLYSEEFFVVRD